MVATFRLVETWVVAGSEVIVEPSFPAMDLATVSALYSGQKWGSEGSIRVRLLCLAIPSGALGGHRCLGRQSVVVVGVLTRYRSEIRMFHHSALLQEICFAVVGSGGLKGLGKNSGFSATAFCSRIAR
jgi:hypothetical protein